MEFNFNKCSSNLKEGKIEGTGSTVHTLHPQQHGTAVCTVYTYIRNYRFTYARSSYICTYVQVHTTHIHTVCTYIYSKHTHTHTSAHACMHTQ